MPPNPTTPTSIANHTCTRLSAPSSVSGLVTCIDRSGGSQNAIAVRVITPTATTRPNALRQPRAWPSHEAIGTPTTVATVSPVITCATALARFFGPIRKDATIAATPKNAPWGRPATKRATISISYDGANMLTRLLIVNTAISPSSTVFRGSRAVRAAINGAPTTTPSAYAEMTWPAVGSEMAKLDAISGSSPIATNSVVPIPNPPRARASTASHRTDGAGATTETGVNGRSSEMVTNVWTFLVGRTRPR